jgi:hypothetical protein
LLYDYIVIYCYIDRNIGTYDDLPINGLWSLSLDASPSIGRSSLWHLTPFLPTAGPLVGPARLSLVTSMLPLSNSYPWFYNVPTDDADVMPTLEDCTNEYDDTEVCVPLISVAFSSSLPPLVVTSRSFGKWTPHAYST